MRFLGSKLSVAERVAHGGERVAHGGHNIPVNDIERRFPRSLKNLFIEYMPLVSEVTCYLNHEASPKLVFEKVDEQLVVSDRKLFEKLKEVAK